MGMLARIRNLLKRENPYLDRRWGWLMPAGVPVTLETALRVSACYACISRIAKAISASPIKIYSTAGERKEELPNDPAAYVLNTESNPEQTALRTKERLMMWALTKGEAYAEISRDGAGRLARLWPLNSIYMELRRINDGKDLDYVYHQPIGAGEVHFAPREIFHLSGPGMGFMGDDALSVAANALALSMAAEQFSLSYFQNGAQLSGFFEYPGKMGPEIKAEMEKQYTALHSGAKNQFHTIILENGMKYQAISVKASEAQVAELREFQLREVARFWDVPLALLQTPEGAQGYGSNISALWQIFVKTCLHPWAERFRQEADRKLFAPRSQKECRIDLSWLTRGDEETRARADLIWREMGVYSVNEIREREGHNHVGAEGDMRMVPTRWTTMEGVQKQIDQIGKTVPPPKPPGGGGGGGNGEGLGTGTGTEGDKVARAAIREVLVMAAERYARRMANRAADLARRKLPEAQVARNLAEERARARVAFGTDCSRVSPLAFQLEGREVGQVEFDALADRLDEGVAPGGAIDTMFPEVTE